MNSDNQACLPYILGISIHLCRLGFSQTSLCIALRDPRDLPLTNHSKHSASIVYPDAPYLTPPADDMRHIAIATKVSSIVKRVSCIEVFALGTGLIPDEIHAVLCVEGLLISTRRLCHKDDPLFAIPVTAGGHRLRSALKQFTFQLVSIKFGRLRY